MNPSPDRMPAPETVIGAVSEETAALLDGLLTGFLELDLQGQVVLEEFTAGHILTYLSREADRMTDEMLHAAGRPSMTPDPDRQWDMRYGADRPGAVLLDDAIESSACLDEAFAGVDDWSVISESARALPGRRLLQLLVHHADLGRSWSDVPVAVAELGVALIPSLLHEDLEGISLITRPNSGIVAREDANGTVIEGDPRQLIAWASGRSRPVDRAPSPPRRTWI